MPFGKSVDFWSVGGFLVGLVGIILAVVFYFRGKSKKILEYQVTSTNLITKDMADIPGISISLDGEPVANLVSSTIKFINAGNQTLFPDDFAKREPLGIRVTGRFLSAMRGYHVASDNANSLPSMMPMDENTIAISFDFLKPKHYFSITILHDGDVSVFGELKAGEKRQVGILPRSYSIWVVILGLSGIFFLVTTLAMDVWVPVSSIVWITIYCFDFVLFMFSFLMIQIPIMKQKFLKDYVRFKKYLKTLIGCPSESTYESVENLSKDKNKPKV